MDPRPDLADRSLAIIFAIFMAWVAFNMYLKNGMSKDLIFPAFMGSLPVVIVFLLKLPIEITAAVLFWFAGAIGLYVGLTEGVTLFAIKNTIPEISWSEEPIAFVVVMIINGIIAIGGMYLVYKGWKNRRKH